MYLPSRKSLMRKIPRDRTRQILLGARLTCERNNGQLRSSQPISVADLEDDAVCYCLGYTKFGSKRLGLNKSAAGLLGLELSVGLVFVDMIVRAGREAVSDCRAQSTAEKYPQVGQSHLTSAESQAAYCVAVVV